MNAKYVAAWKRRNRDKYNDYMTGYRQINSLNIQRQLKDPDEYLFERDSRKRNRMLRATPGWADHAAIRNVYHQYATRYPHLKIQHKIPICHKSVCGLHTVENLEIVSYRFQELRGRFNLELERKRLYEDLKKRGLTI